MNDLTLGHRLLVEDASGTFKLETFWERLLEYGFRERDFAGMRRVEQELRAEGRSSWDGWKITLVGE